MIDESDFSFTKETIENGTLLTLKGVINERTELDGLFDDLKGDKLIINLKGITRINSCGVRDWVKATQPLAEKFDIGYVECSRGVVDQLNMIVNFLSSGKIVSFFAPYYCDDCDEERDMLIVTSEHFPEGVDPGEAELPDFECPECGKAMEFNEDEDNYFSFLS